MSNETDRRRRAEERRKQLTIRKTDLAHSHLPLHVVDGPEAVSLVAELTRLAWELSGRPFPGYDRADIPHRFVPRSR